MIVGVVMIVFIVEVSVEGDVVVGEKVFWKCKVCYVVGEGVKNRVGLVFNGVVGFVWG